MFIDHAKIYVKAGDGGDGSIHFRREAYIPRGGPDGGDGGAGGDVILLASSEVSTLIDLHYQQQYKANRGDHGSGKTSSGKSALHRFIPLPVGTLVHDADTGELLADLTEQGQQFIAAKGGWGGRGNDHFKSPIRQAPYIAEPGQKGQERWLALELKFLADVGLVGLPNAGKSTLISVISNSRPKIADYPFTTLIPNLGVVQWGRTGENHFTVADIPGLIEGAHEGKGLGTQFLRHVERTTLLVHLVDVSDFAVSDPVEAFKTVRSELAAYPSSGLNEKPFMVVATKNDIAGKQAVQLKQYCKKKRIPFFEISAATGLGVASLVRKMGEKVKTARSRQIVVPQGGENVSQGS
jgi:GTP-binding protein